MKKASTLTGAIVLGLATLGGCTGHGKHTAEGLNRAQRQLNGIKSAQEYQMAEAAFQAENFPKALRYVDNSIALNQEVVKSHVLRGRILMEQGDIEGARKSFENAEAIDGEAVDPQYFLGLLYERTDQPERALARFAKATEIEPTEAQYALAVSEVMIDLGQVNEAKSFLEERREQFQHNAGIRQTFGHIAMMQGDSRTAVKEFNAARLLAPDDQGIVEDLVQAQYRSEMFAEAESNLNRMLKVEENQGRRDLQLLRANCLVKVERVGEAREILVRLTRDKTGSDDVDAFIALGNVSYILKDLPRLRTAAQRVVAIAPNRFEGYLLRAMYQRQSGDLASAEISAQKAVEHDGGSAAWALLAMVQRDAGKGELAEQSFQRAAEIEAERQTDFSSVPESATE